MPLKEHIYREKTRQLCRHDGGWKESLSQEGITTNLLLKGEKLYLCIKFRKKPRLHSQYSFPLLYCYKPPPKALSAALTPQGPPDECIHPDLRWGLDAKRTGSNNTCALPHKPSVRTTASHNDNTLFVVATCDELRRCSQCGIRQINRN